MKIKTEDRWPGTCVSGSRGFVNRNVDSRKRLLTTHFSCHDKSRVLCSFAKMCLLSVYLLLEIVFLASSEKSEMNSALTI
jgi:hypothetical protein